MYIIALVLVRTNVILGWLQTLLNRHRLRQLCFYSSFPDANVGAYALADGSIARSLTGFYAEKVLGVATVLPEMSIACCAGCNMVSKNY